MLYTLLGKLKLNKMSNTDIMFIIQKPTLEIAIFLCAVPAEKRGIIYSELQLLNENFKCRETEIAWQLVQTIYG